MNRRHFLGLFLASAGALIAGSVTNAGGFRLHLPEQARRNSLLIASARAMYDLCNALAAAYKSQNPHTDFVIEKGDSLQGLIAAKRGAIDLAAITRDLTASEDGLATYNYLIARSNISIIVHAQSPIKNLTQAQIRALFVGEISNWKQVGGSDLPVTLYSRVRGSSTRQYVEEVVLDGGDFASSTIELETTKALAAAVAADPAAIGYLAAKDNSNNAEVSYLSVDGVVASEATVLSGRYPYTHPFYLLLAGDKTQHKVDFIKFAQSSVGQAIVTQQGLVAVC
jgi:phosphate transport system substrate-binding protein